MLKVERYIDIRKIIPAEYLQYSEIILIIQFLVDYLPLIIIFSTLFYIFNYLFVTDARAQSKIYMKLSSTKKLKLNHKFKRRWFYLAIICYCLILPYYEWESTYWHLKWWA